MAKKLLTEDQQNEQRARMMKSASTIIGQLDEYLERGVVTVGGRRTVMTSERLTTYRLVLSKTLPDLTAREVTHRNELEALSSEQLMAKLKMMASKSPILAKKLQDAIGGKVIEGEVKVEKVEEVEEAEKTAEETAEEKEIREKRARMRPRIGRSSRR